MDCKRVVVCIRSASDPSKYAATLKYCVARGYLVVALAADFAGAVSAVLAGTADLVVAESRSVVADAPFEVMSMDLTPHRERHMRTEPAADDHRRPIRLK